MNTDKTKLLTAALLVGLALAAPGCKRHKAPPPAAETTTSDLAAGVHMGDPKVADQLVVGFHDIEANAWRWTNKEFSVVLRPPTGSAQAGAALIMNLTVPPVTIDKLTQVTLTPSIHGTALPSQTYNKAGDYVYQCDVPGTLLQGPSVRIDFQLDKAIPPSGADQRELGLVVLGIKLTLK
ncbi:MAG TPA: hypothetical protein VGH38_02525 [Bryobacteraceae bacterium]|jgi:hypothetical protein